MVHWLRLCTPNAGGLGSIPGQGTRSRMLQLKDPACRNEDPTCRNEDPTCHNEYLACSNKDPVCRN